MKTKNTTPRPRTKRPLLVYKMDQFTWIAACRRCWFIRAYYSHPLALKAAISHHSKCLNKAAEQTCSYGWIELQSLWSEGEVPFRRKTADQLPVGHFFTGKILDSQSTPILLCVGLTERMKVVVDGTYFMDSYAPASDWEVIADHGPFQKPEGE